MTVSRKDQAKIDFLNSSEGAFLKQVMERHNVSIDQISDTMLPDDFVFDGEKVVGGMSCKTVGEYKEALLLFSRL